MHNSINDIRSKCARFYKVDLHVHSPLSFDWENNSTPTYAANSLLNRLGPKDKISKKQLDAFANELERSGLDVAVITDHMKYSFGVALADHVSRIKRKITVLPGMEVNLRVEEPVLKQFRIQALTIFPADIGDSIRKIFPADFKKELELNGDDEIHLKSIEEFTEKVRSVGGRTVFVQIRDGNGLKCAYKVQGDKLVLDTLSEEREDAWKDICITTGDAFKKELNKFDALQISGPAGFMHYKSERRNFPVSLVMGTDAHHVGAFGKNGRVSYIKMDRKNAHSLFEAFKFSGTRIRFKDDLPVRRPPKIKGIRIIGHPRNKRSLFKNANVGFSDNLTCVVGPRGSGKSTLIDAIRYVMGFNRSLDEIEKVKRQILDRQANTLDASKIELLYEKSDGSIHKIVSIYDPQENYCTRVFNIDDNEIDIKDVEECGDYPLNLYGWNELELLGEDPKAQRENLDKFIKGAGRLKNERKLLYRELVRISEEALKQLETMDAYFAPEREETSFVRLNEFRDEFNKLNPRGIEKKFEKLDDIVQKISFLSHLKEELPPMDEGSRERSEINYQDALFKHPAVDDWCRNLLQENLQINRVNDEITKKKGEIACEILEMARLINDAEASLLDERNGISKEIRAAIGEKEAITAELRGNAKKRLDSAIEQFETYKRDLGVFEEHLSKQRRIIDQIVDVNQRIFETRNKEISEIISKISIVTDPGFDIRLKLVQEKDKTDFLSALEKNDIGMNFEGKLGKKGISHLIADKFNPFTFADAVFGGTPDKLIHKIRFRDDNIEHIYSMDKKHARKFIEDNLPYENIQELNIRRYDKEKVESLFRIQHIAFDDQFYIELNGKPIQYCSPGQRCSAMLPIVTLTSNAPIIIDQPEDNLDNRLVSKAIFKILSKLKETRQVILATHNPNILVSGDAEQVVVLNGTGDIERYGSIDEPLIVGNVIELMEGGKDSFERRRNKYREHIFN